MKYTLLYLYLYLLCSSFILKRELIDKDISQKFQEFWSDTVSSNVFISD